MRKNGAFTVPEPGVRKSSGILRGLWHALLGVGGWILLVYAWMHLAQGIYIYRLVSDLTLGVFLVCAGAIVVVAWIVHNIGIVRRKGEQRRTVRPVTEDWSQDYLGRRITGPLEACRRAAYVEISSTWEEKRYRPAPVSDLGLEALARARQVREEEEAELPPVEEVLRQ